MLYERNDVAFERGRFRVRGDVVEVHPANMDDEAIRVEFFGDEIDRLTRFDPLTGHTIDQLTTVTLYPAKQFVTPRTRCGRRWGRSARSWRSGLFTLRSMGICWSAADQDAHGVRSGDDAGDGILQRHRELLAASQRAPAGFAAVHIARLFSRAISCSSWMKATRRSRRSADVRGRQVAKTVLVNYGFRLPSALDNRPLRFPEFMELHRAEAST
jgi:excinuclease ABC subunit B